MWKQNYIKSENLFCAVLYVFFDLYFFRPFFALAKVKWSDNRYHGKLAFNGNFSCFVFFVLGVRSFLKRRCWVQLVGYGALMICSVRSIGRRIF